MQVTTYIRRLGRRLINELTKKRKYTDSRAKHVCAIFADYLFDFQRSIVIAGYPLCTVAHRGHPYNFFD